MKILNYYIKDYLIKNNLYNVYSNKISDSFNIYEIQKDIINNIHPQLINKIGLDFINEYLTTISKDIILSDDINLVNFNSLSLLNHSDDLSYIFDLLPLKKIKLKEIVSNNKLTIEKHYSYDWLNDLIRVKNYTETYKNNVFLNLSRIIKDYKLNNNFFNNLIIMTEEQFLSFLLNIKDYLKKEFIENLMHDIKNYDLFRDKYEYISLNLLKLLSYNEIDRILVEDLNYFLKYIEKEEKKLNIFNQRLGLKPFKKVSLQYCGDIYSITRERVRQIEDTLFKKYKDISRLDLKYLGEILKEHIYKDNSIILFPLLKERFNSTLNYYEYLSNILDYPNLKKELQTSVPLPIIENFYLNNKEPFSYSAIYNLILNDTNINENLISLSINNLIDNNILIKNNNNYYVNKLKMKKSSIITNELLGEENGLQINNICEILKTKYKIKIKRLGVQDVYTNLYLYEKSTYRHLNYFYDLYDQSEIDNILNLSKNFILENKNQKMKLSELKKYLDSKYKKIYYYDLRFIISSFGVEHNILFIGKSNHDVISIGEYTQKKNLDISLLDTVNNTKSLFTMDDLLKQYHTYSYHTLNALINKMMINNIIFKVDNNNYVNKNFFNNQNGNLIINEINLILENFDNNSIISLRYLLSILNSKLKKNYHKNYIISILKIYGNNINNNVNITEYNLFLLGNKNKSGYTSVKQIFDEYYIKIEIDTPYNECVKIIFENLLKDEIFVLKEELSSYIGFYMYNKTKEIKDE